MSHLVALLLTRVLLVHAQYSEILGIKYFYYAGASYCHPESIESWTCSFCSVANVTATVLYDQKTDTQAYVGYELASNSVMISFRGTDILSLPNWIEDLSFGKTRDYNQCAGCKIDDGFAKCHDAIENDVYANVKQRMAMYPGAGLVVVGHSLGGALAVLTAADLAVSYPNTSISVYTYGCPRVGNPAFAQYFNSLNSTSYRVVHWADPVARLPPQQVNYEHVESQIFYNQPSTNYEVCAGDEDPHCSDKLVFDPLGIIDHLTYMKIDFMSKWLQCKA